jgi:hypothetical protein
MSKGEAKAKNEQQTGEQRNGQGETKALKNRTGPIRDDQINLVTQPKTASLSLTSRPTS